MNDTTLILLMFAVFAISGIITGRIKKHNL